VDPLAGLSLSEVVVAVPPRLLGRDGDQLEDGRSGGLDLPAGGDDAGLVGLRQGVSMRGRLRTVTDAPRTWFMLLHTRGPAVAEDQSVFEHPGIAEHYAFLGRRVAAGELVAAGPLSDEPGSGMTVLDVADLDTATRLATEDDQAVVGGVLRVQVRPWHVEMARSD
jgi:uncharacterized protein YciI